ncbi:MAG: hypothetical protein Q7T20_12145 [Saprospiraceae bacterium]|nr:hypothetical protein [Saprospiraceae bacterium]
MKNLFFKRITLAIVFLAIAQIASAQPIQFPAIHTITNGGARILVGQGQTAADPAFGFTGSTLFPNNLNDGGGGNGIFRPLANTMAFATSSTERMRITPGGAVGIGITTPLQKLHVASGIMISGPNPGFGGPMLLFSDNVTPAAYPNGRWGLEYVSRTPTYPNQGGLNFWRPWNPLTGGGANWDLFLKDDGRIGMGIDPNDPNHPNPFPSGYRLYVKGGILTERLKIANYNSSQWADYVFAPDYVLKPLSEVEAFVKANKHLPNVPSAQDIEKDGLDVADMLARQMEKIEELMLYTFELNKRVEKLEAENAALKQPATNSVNR